MTLTPILEKLRQRVWFRTLVRVLKEVWIPVGLAVLWTTYSMWSKEKWSWADAGQTFGGAFIFLGFFAGYVVRSLKVVLDQDRHANLLERQEKTVSRLEETAQEVANYATGGDSYAYGAHFHVSADCVAGMFVFLKGKYPLYELQVSVKDANALFAMSGRKNVPFEEVQKTHLATLEFGTVPTNRGHNRPMSLSLSRERTNRFHLNWDGRNGGWYQRLEVQFIDGQWEWATYVKRDEKDLLEQGSQNFPRTADGKLTFTHGPLEA